MRDNERHLLLVLVAYPGSSYPERASNRSGGAMNSIEAMALATELSLRGLGATSPNPIVGAVLTSADGSLISTGFHHRMSSPDHAEVIAIKSAGINARGAHLYLTLEPCNHSGTTPPCVDAIIAAQIAAVTFVSADPNPKAAGGANRLRAAGIKVNQAFCPESEFANRAWLKKVHTGLPLITWKIATTIDGKIAANDGTSQWITSDGARADVQLLRRQSDAIMVGTNTAILDNPLLTPRTTPENSAGYTANPVRIVFGKKEIPSTHHLYDASAETIFLKSSSMDDFIKVIKENEFNSVLVEAGPTLGTALLLAGLIDEILHYQAPTILGSGMHFVSDLGIATLADRIDLTLASSQVIDGNIKSHYLVQGGI